MEEMAGWAETLRGERLRFDHLLLATGAVAAPADRVGRAARRRAIWGDVDALTQLTCISTAHASATRWPDSTRCQDLR